MNIIDLKALNPESLNITLPNGDMFCIPGSVSVKCMTKLMALEEKIKKPKEHIEVIKSLQEYALIILSLDKNKNIDLNYIEENLDDMVLLFKFPSIFKEHMDNVIKGSNIQIPNAQPPEVQ